LSASVWSALFFNYRFLVESIDLLLRFSADLIELIPNFNDDILAGNKLFAI